VFEGDVHDVPILIATAYPPRQAYDLTGDILLRMLAIGTNVLNTASAASHAAMRCLFSGTWRDLEGQSAVVMVGLSYIIWVTSIIGRKYLQSADGSREP
jgi:hypothetical protein